MGVEVDLRRLQNVVDAEAEEDCDRDSREGARPGKPLSFHESSSYGISAVKPSLGHTSCQCKAREDLCSL